MMFRTGVGFTLDHMSPDRLLICSVSAAGDDLVCACTHCGWLSTPVPSGTEAGRLWDGHMAAAHASAIAQLQ